MDQFTGKTAFITGGAQGIGLGIAKACLKEGMRVAIADIKGEQLRGICAVGFFRSFSAFSGPQSQYFPADFRCNSTLRQVVLPLSAGKSAPEPEPG